MKRTGGSDEVCSCYDVIVHVSLSNLESIEVSADQQTLCEHLAFVRQATAWMSSSHRQLKGALLEAKISFKRSPASATSDLSIMTQLSSMRQTRSRARDVKREDEVDTTLGIMQGADTPTLDDSAWEDEDDLTTQSRNTTPLRQNRNGTPRKRRMRPGSSPRKQLATPVSKPPTDEGSVAREQIANSKPSTDGVAIKEQIAKSALEGAMFTGRYLLDVVGNALFLMRKPLSVLLGLFLLSLVVAQAWTTIQGVFAPLCILPGVSRAAICRRNRVADSDQQAPRWADYSRLVDVQSRTFEQLLEESLGGPTLSLEIKKAEMATTDLVTLVRVSNLKSRNMLAESLVEFVDHAKKTGRGLQKLTSKIGGAVDK